MQASIVVLLPFLFLLELSWAIVVDPAYSPVSSSEFSTRNNEPQYLQDLPFDDNNFVLPTNEDGNNANMQQNEAFILSLSKPLGEISGLAIDERGQLIAFHRADRIWDESTFDKNEELNKKLGLIPNSTIAVIDPTNGQIIAEHGEKMFYMPHGLTIDDKGNTWVTDIGSHQVHKLDSSFKPVLSLGEKLIPGSDERHFCKPTDIAVAKNGYFFVADGYCNSRVMKFDPSGKLVDTFGASGDEFGSSDFVIPHSLALIEDMNLICVADRENERVQCFSAGLAEGHRTIPAGIPITNAEQIGRVYAIREKKHYLVGVTGRDMDGQLEPQLFVMDMTSGKANTFIKNIENAHSLAISDTGTVYVSQMHPNQIVQISLPDQQ